MKTAIAVSVLSVAACFCALLLTIRATVAAVPGEIAVTRSLLIGQVAALRIDALAEIDSQANGIRKDVGIMIPNSINIMTDVANKQLTGLRSDTMTRVDHMTVTVDGAVNKADDLLTGLRYDIRPVIANTAALAANAAALTKDAQDSWDDSYDDVRGLLLSAEFATTQTAQTMQTVREAAPQFLATSQETNHQFAGIATDVHRFTTKFTAPTSLKTKIWDGFKSMALIASHF
jgi:ABC-type transporter Mla subunit MlaD